MSASKPMKMEGTPAGNPLDVSGHHPQSFASRMAKMPVQQEQEKVARPMSSYVERRVSKSVDNKAPLKSKFDPKVGDKGRRQFAASSDAVDSSKGRRRDCHRDLSGHHPLSFASRKAMMDATRESIPERQAAETSSHQDVVVPKPCPSATLPQDLLSNVEIERQPQPRADDVADAGPVRQFRNPAPIRLPVSVVLAASRSFVGTVSDARSAVRVVEFDELSDSIGFAAERCEVSNDDRKDRDCHAAKSDPTLRVQGAGLRRASRGKPARPSSQTWSEIRDADRAKVADGKKGGTVGGPEGSDQR